jgi:hypothetical protein
MCYECRVQGDYRVTPPQLARSVPARVTTLTPGVTPGARVLAISWVDGSAGVDDDVRRPWVVSRAGVSP